MIQSDSALKGLSWEQKRNDLEWVLGLCFLFSTVKFLHHTIFLHSAAGTQLWHAVHVYCVYALLSECAMRSQRCGYKLRHPCTLRPFFQSQEAKTYWLVHSIYTPFLLAQFSHVPLPCHILPLYLSVSPSPLYIPHSFALSRTKKHVLALRKLCPCANTDTVL